MPERVILLDCDGVLADFFSGCCRLWGRYPRELYPQATAYDFWPLLEVGLTRNDFYGRLAAAGEDFWSELETYPHAQTLYGVCTTLAPTWVSTAPTRDPRCLSGKQKWLHRFMGRYPDNVMLGRDKHLMAGPGRLLVDDREENCALFTRHGGEAILYPRPWNRRRGEDGPAAHLTVLQEIEGWAARQ